MSDSDELEEMLSEHKDLLTQTFLSEEMDTQVILRELKKHDVLDDRDIEEILTSRDLLSKIDKNGALLERLQKRGPDAFDVFFRILTDVHPPLADQLLPVGCCILWFCPSPSLAAMAEHTLNKYYHVNFSNIKGRRSQKKYLHKRGRVFLKDVSATTLSRLYPDQDSPDRIKYVKGSRDCEVTLTFPITDKPELVELAIQQVLSDHSGHDLFVMSGVCEGIRSDGGEAVRSGEVIIVTDAHRHPGVDQNIPAKNDFIGSVRRELKLHSPPWLQEARSKLAAPIGDHPRLAPHYGGVCSSPAEAAAPRLLASDSHSYQFYQQCQQHVGGADKPWFSCLGVRSYTSINNEEGYHDDSSCSMASVGTAVEVCQGWYNRRADKK